MLEDVNLADFAKLLQDTLTELMRLTVGSTAEQRARGVPEELRLEPYPLEYFCVRAVQIDGKPSIPIVLMMSRPAVALMLKLDCFPNAGTAKWRYFVTLPAVVYPVYAVAGRYGHGGLYVLQDRSDKFLYEKGLLAEDQTLHACAGPRFIKLKDYEKKNTTYWPTKDAREAVLGEVHNFEKLFDDDGHPHTPLMIKVPGPRKWPACSSTLHLTLEAHHVFSCAHSQRSVGRNSVATFTICHSRGCGMVRRKFAPSPSEGSAEKERMETTYHHAGSPSSSSSCDSGRQSP